MEHPTKSERPETVALEAPLEDEASLVDEGPAERPGRPPADLLLIHPGLDLRTVQRLLPDLWPEGDPASVPPGYLEIPSTLPSLRLLVHEARARELPAEDPDLAARVQAWVDSQAQRLDLPQVLTGSGLDFWAFLRDDMVDWLQGLMALRAQILGLTDGEGLAVVAAGLDPFERRLITCMAAGGDRSALRAEIACVPPPVRPVAETVTGRRARKTFFLVQDAWHGVRFLVEDLLVRRPKVLFVSDRRCWMRRRGADGGWARTDVHLEGVWREGRRRPYRLYYRSDSYHPDVGAMTGSRIPPVYWRHLLFLLAQKSRGALETRSIQRHWRRLSERADLREGLVFEGLDISELVLGWLDRAVALRLPAFARAARRESHFLRGIRPAAILLPEVEGPHRPLLAAARRLGIPTAALQLAPGRWARGSCTGAGTGTAGFPTPRSLPDRLCVFSPMMKTCLVERARLDPATVVVTGDPRLDAVAIGAPLDREVRQRWMRDWGVEEGQRIVGVVCRPGEIQAVLAWIASALGPRQDVFLLFGLSGSTLAEERACRQAAAAHRLAWIQLLEQDRFREAMDALDLILSTSCAHVAEGVLRRRPVVHLHLRAGACTLQPDPGALVHHAASTAELRPLLEQAIAGRLAAPPQDEAWRAYVRAVFGDPQGGAAARVFDALAELTRTD